MNPLHNGVYGRPMRTLLWIASLIPGSLLAQPDPPSFCFVVAKDADRSWPFVAPLHVVEHYRQRWGYEDRDQMWLLPDTAITLQAAPAFPAEGALWERYYPHLGAENYLLLIADADTMRVDLPDARWLLDRALRRWDRDTPEVLFFHPGHFQAMDLFQQPAADQAADRLAQGLIAVEETAYQRQLAEAEARAHAAAPRESEPVPRKDPVPSTPDPVIEVRRGLEHITIARQRADSLWLRITGSIMLDGGCASNMPFFGIEMATDTGWVERLPMRDVQMDCGMPTAEWEDHVLMLPPLRWWVTVGRPASQKELVTGMYRLVLQGANGQLFRTDPFLL